MVDPYDWLGLPPGPRPPTYYQLLGLSPVVDDPMAIRAAGDRQFRRLLPHMTEANALEAERLWAEVEEARDTLLDPDRRADYDASLPNTAGVADAAAASAEEPEEPLSPADLEAATEPDPDPWWKSAPEAPVGPEPWWKETVAEKPEPPPPPVRAIPSAIAPARSPSGRKGKGGRRKPSSAPVVLGGLLVAGVIVGGVYLGFGRQPPEPGPKSLPVVEGSKAEPKARTVEPRPRDREATVSEAPLPKDFADQLKQLGFSGHKGAVNAVSVNAGGTRFVSAGTDRTIRIWSIRKEEATLRHTFASPAVGVAWCAQDTRLVASDGHSLVMLDAVKDTPPGKSMDSPRGGVTAVAAAADGSKALTGLTDGYLRLWDTASGRSDEWPGAPRGAVMAVDVSADGTRAVAAFSEGPVSLWNLVNRTRLLEWNPHPGGAIAVRLSPDGRRVATAGADGVGAVYDVGERTEVCRLDGHGGPVTGIEWLPDGRQVVTVSVDGTARLWSADTGYPLQWSQSLDGKGNCVAVDPGGRYVLAGTSAGTIHLFPLPRVRSEVIQGTPARPPAEPFLHPDPADVAIALTRVRTELAPEFTYTRPDDLAILADNLRRRAWVEQRDAAQRYGLLQEARALAVKAADPVTAFRAIEDLCQWFELDELAEKAATIRALPAAADGPALIAVGLVAAERAETDPRPEVLEAILRRLPAEAPPGTPADHATRLGQLRKRAEAATAESRKLRQAIDVLKNAPDDQKSNHTLGTFLCLTRQDWIAGLPHLVKGTDPRLIDAARADLAGPTDPKAQHRVGELWFALAIDARDHRHKRALLGRARTWFERESKAKLEVVDAVKARARLDDIASQDVPARDPLTLPLFTPTPTRRAYNTLGPEVVRNEWLLNGGADIRANGVVLPAGSPVLQSRFGLAPGGRLTLAVQPDGRELRVNCAGQEFPFALAGKQARLTIERRDDQVVFSAVVDDEAPVTRTASLPETARHPTRLAIRLTGMPAREGGAVLVSAIVRGPASLPLPLPE